MFSRCGWRRVCLTPPRHRRMDYLISCQKLYELLRKVSLSLPIHPKNDREAAKLFQWAADSGDEEAQSSIGIMYEQGTGVDQNSIEALKWFILAAEAGDGIGVSHRDQLLTKLTLPAISEARRRAAE